MSTFTQNNYKDRLLEQIKLHYGFSDIQWVGRIGGLSAQNDEVTAESSPLILKNYLDKTEEDVLRIEKITQFLCDHSIPAVPALISNYRESHFTFEKKLFALFPKTSGQILHEPQLTEKSLTAVATLLAQIHKIDIDSLKISELPNRTFPHKNTQLTIDTVLSSMKRGSLDISYERQVLDLLQTKLETLSNYIPLDFIHSHLQCKSFVHGDFHNENIIFDDSLKITRLLDFEESHIGCRVTDVLHFVLIACCSTGFQLSHLEKAQFFVRKYCDIFPLTHEEVVCGIYCALLKDCRSFFIEKKLYETNNLFFIHLVKRDLEKIIYIRERVNELADYLLS